MNNAAGDSTGDPSTQPPSKQSIMSLPSSRLGWWAVGLGVLFSVLWTINTFLLVQTGSGDQPLWMQLMLPFYGIIMLFSGLGAGILALVALFRRGERSWLVYITLLPFLLVIFLLAGEFLVPH